MQFYQLEAFVGVARYKSFSRAAENLFISQPTVSAHIKSLENETGTQLIIRNGRETLLTEAGERFLSYAEHLINIRDTAVADMSSLSGHISGTLRVAASTVPTQYILPDVFSAMQKLYPEVHYEAIQQDSMSVIDCIRSCDIEIGICGTRVNEDTCCFEHIFTDRLTIITPNNEYFQSFKGCLPASELAHARYVTREEGSGTRIEAANFFRELRIDTTILNNAAHFGSTEAIKQAVRAGLGISVISSLAARDYVDFGYLLGFDFDTPSLDRSFYLITSKKRVLSPAAAVFRSLILESFL